MEDDDRNTRVVTESSGLDGAARIMTNGATLKNTNDGTVPVFGPEQTYDPTFGVPENPGFEDFVTSGGRWTNGGGFTTVLGGPGGTIAWSIAGAGLANQTGQTFFTGSTVAMGTFLPFNFQTVLQQAFDDWSTFGDINFGAPR